MKKLFALILTVGAALALHADEAAVRKVFAEVNRLGLEWKLSEALKYYTPDFTEVSADGKTVDIGMARKAARVLEVMNRPDASLSEMLVAARGVAGGTVSDAELKQYQELEQSEQGANMARMIRAAWATQLDGMRKKMREQTDSFVITGVKVDGDRAEAVFRQKNIESGRMEEHRCELVKKDGSWLIRRDVAKYEKAK